MDFGRTEPVPENILEAKNQIVKKENGLLHPLIVEMFEDPKFFSGLPMELQQDIPLLAEYIENTSRFHQILGKEKREESGLFAERITIPETKNEAGKTRASEQGRKVNLDYLSSIGIDPARVLVFRVTQPSETPKPEYYWTTDFFETQRGLTREIGPEKRKSAITLISNLKTIAGKSGLIQDINDDNGLAVRQIDTNSFDQKQCIGIIK